MDNQEETLTHHNYRPFDPSPLLETIRKESNLKNVCLLVVVVILVCNYLQMQHLTNNYKQLESLNQEMIASLKKNSVEIQNETHSRQQENGQLKNELVKNIDAVKKFVEDAVSEIRTESTRLKEKISKLQAAINKLKTSTKAQQTQKKINTNNAVSSYNSSQAVNSFEVSFLMNQVKEQFHEYKQKWFKSLLSRQIFQDEKIKDSFLTALANIQLPHVNALSDKFNKEVQQKISKRLAQKYDFHKERKELPFCIVVPTYNNAKNFRYEYNLLSILKLNYTNYKVVIVDDASNDGTADLIENLIASLSPKVSITVLRNDIQMTAVPNINKAVREHCEQTDIVVLVDGDDELLARESLKVFNIVYQQQGADMVYSNHLKLYWHEDQVYKGWSEAYTAEEKAGNLYREVIQKISPLRSFKASLFLQIREQDLKDQHGAWLRSTYDQVICLPMLQLSCGRNVFVDEYFYLYNFGIGSNDLMLDSKLQLKVADYVKYNKRRYECKKNDG